MKTTNLKFAAAAAVIVLGSSAAAFVWHPWTGKLPAVAARPAAVAVQPVEKPPVAAVSEPAPSVAPAAPAPVVEASPTPPASKLAAAQPTPPPANNAKAPAAPGKKSGQKPPSPPKPSLQDPLAREALSYVGDDPLAEQYWVSAINNPSLPAEERKDLIEDLNEDGFPDRRNLTREDVPLIVSRLQLIEDLAPGSMDQVNSEAFQEAYKDLVNMLGRVP